MLPESLALYISIRRLHRRLPKDLRELGNHYLKSEFDRHRKAEAVYIPPFLREWKQYRDMLTAQVELQQPGTGEGKGGVEVGSNGVRIGKKLDSQLLNQLTDAQIGQLYELREAAKNPQQPDSNKQS